MNFVWAETFNLELVDFPDQFDLIWVNWQVELGEELIRIYYFFLPRNRTHWTLELLREWKDEKEKAVWVKEWWLGRRLRIRSSPSF